MFDEALRQKLALAKVLRDRRCRTALAVAVMLSAAPLPSAAAPHRLQITISAKSHTRLAHKIDAMFSKGGPQAVLTRLRAQGWRCSGPNRSGDPLPNYIRCDKRGWLLLGPIKRWIVVDYDEKTHKVLVDSTWDL
jgi:hypothetical protein